MVVKKVSRRRKARLLVVIHYSKGSHFYEDYLNASVWFDGKKIKEFGDYYHDKGEERAESFAEGYAMALNIPAKKIRKENRADIDSIY